MELKKDWIDKYLEGEDPDVATLKQLIRKVNLAISLRRAKAIGRPGSSASKSPRPGSQRGRGGSG